MQHPSSYLNLIAGAMDVHAEGLIEDSIELVAREALATDRVHCLIADKENNGRVLYFAIPSADLSSEMTPVSQLAAALPGHPDHKGDGVYVLNASPYKIAATVYDDTLSVVVHEAAQIDTHIYDTGLPVYSVDHAVPRRFESAYSKLRTDAGAIGKWVSIASVSIGVVSVIAMLVASVANLYLTSGSHQNEDIGKIINQAVKGIATSPPLIDKIMTLQSRSSVAIRAGGWIDHYEIKDDKESFRFYMPSWITRDYLESLGPSVRADQTQVAPSLIQVVTGNPVQEDYSAAGKAAEGISDNASSDKAERLTQHVINAVNDMAK